MDRQEDCRLIAEFLGWNKSLGITYFKDKRITTAKHFDFVANGDWNGLMEVVEKISDKLNYSLNATLEFLSEEQDRDGLYGIEDVYQAVLEFIKWYNNQTK